MQVLDIGTNVYVKASIVAVSVEPGNKITYRVNIPSFGNFYCSSEQMNERIEESGEMVRKNAHWKKIKVGDRDSLMCSGCNSDSGNIYPTNYCPNCGAYMKGPKGEEK